jgi:IS1 family transposase
VKQQIFVLESIVICGRSLFVDDKGNKQWVWLALDVATREIIGCHVGDRSQVSAQALRDSLT